jgi:ferrochelatase
MRLNNVLSIINGTTNDTPFVSHFDFIAFELKDVHRGSLFFCFDVSEIDKALDRGVYGIVTTLKSPFKHSEMAWIEVDDIEEATKKFLRFFLIARSTTIFKLQKTTHAILEAINTDHSLYALQTFTPRDASKLYKYSDIRYIIMDHDDSVFTPKPLTYKHDDNIVLLSQKPFEVTFSFYDDWMKTLHFSPHYFDELKHAIYFLESNELHYNLDHINRFTSLQPLFINKQLELLHYGKSQMIVLTQADATLALKEIAFLQTVAPWAKMLIVRPTLCSVAIENSISINSVDEVPTIIQEESFNYLLIVGFSKEEVSILFHHHQDQDKLF